MSRSEEERNKEVERVWRGRIHEGSWVEAEKLVFGAKLVITGDDGVITEKDAKVTIPEKKIDAAKRPCPRFTCSGSGELSEVEWEGKVLYFVSCDVCDICTLNFQKEEEAWKEWEKFSQNQYLESNGEWNGLPTIQGYHWVLMAAPNGEKVMAIRYFLPLANIWMAGSEAEKFKILRCWGPIPEPMIGEI